MFIASFSASVPSFFGPAVLRMGLCPPPEIKPASLLGAQVLTPGLPGESL